MTPAEYTAAFQAKAAEKPVYPADRFSGRGIVICAGGKYLPGAWVLIGMLRRHLGCFLPIEVWSLPHEDASILTAWNDVTLRKGDASCGWALKPHAIVHSEFSQVIYIDADNVPVRDPAFLFELSEYDRTGALFWTLGGRTPGAMPMWQAAGMRSSNEPFFESGQIVLDKSRCWAALQLTQWMNENSAYWYSVTGGDANTFLLAWRALKQPFATPAKPPILAKNVTYQFGFDGLPLFQHRYGAKWKLTANPVISGFQDEAVCRAILGTYPKAA